MAYGLLKGKRGIVFGALNEQSIAWKVAERVVEEGATITLTNTAIALRMGTLNDLAAKTGAKVIACDATSIEDLENVFIESQKELGGKIDFVLHSIGMSPNVRKGIPYDDINYANMTKTLDISAISLHKMLSVAKKLDAISEGGSVVALTYIAAQRSFVGYSDMADAKSLLESITRNFGMIYGKIVELMDRGAVVELSDGVEGFATPKHLVKEDGTQAQLGEVLDFKVIEFNRDSRRIIVSHSRIFEDDQKAKRQEANNERQAVRETIRQESASVEKSTLGDIDALAELREKLEDQSEE